MSYQNHPCEQGLLQWGPTAKPCGHILFQTWSYCVLIRVTDISTCRDQTDLALELLPLLKLVFVTLPFPHEGDVVVGGFRHRCFFVKAF
eukprot:528862-Amphidinium_carterae.1